jgi:hypothetical protein
MCLLEFQQADLYNQEIVCRRFISFKSIMFFRLLIIILEMGLLTSACGSDPSQRASPIFTQKPSPTVEVVETVAPSPSPSLGENTTSLDDAEDLLNTLTNGDMGEKGFALQRIRDAQDERFVAVLIELIRAAQIGLVRNVNYSAVLDTLEDLSGQPLGDDWPAWVEWYGSTALAPPPGFTSWKGRLLSGIDPQFAGFLQDDHPSRIRVEEIQWGGVLVDGIPALSNPFMISASQANYLDSHEPVFGIALNGDARAYPLRILDWHEMANDVVGGVPVSLAYCTLCGAGIAFDGRASDGRIYTFGSSGFLYRSNKLMYDRETRTLWNQLTGEPVLGELADTDLRLLILPIVLTSWADWLEQHLETQVLSLETGYERPYELGAAYGDYFSFDDTMFPVWQRSKELQPRAHVYALYLDGVPKAYALERLVEDQVVNDLLGEIPLVLIGQRGTVEVEGLNQRVGPVNYDSGGEVRAFQRGDHIFSPGPQADTVMDEQGNIWQVTEDALVGPDEEMAPRLAGHLAYWFGWFAFFPNTLVYK